jgi:hypothetical protein
MMAIYESSRRRAVIKFPPDIKGNPFLEMCEAGDFPPMGDPNRPDTFARRAS